MPFELDSFAKQHFERESHQSLVAAIHETLDPEILLDVLASDCRQLQFLAVRQLQSLQGEYEIQALLRAGLENAESRQATLATMSFLTLPYETETLEILSRLLDDAESEVRKAAARVIVFQNPDLIETEIVTRLDSPDATHLARLLCYSPRVDLIRRLTEIFGYPERRLPPVIGFLLTPQWLAEHAFQHSGLVESLAEECGYSEGISADAAADFWQQGFMFVGPAMIASGISLKKLRQRIFEICYCLLPFDMEMEHRSAISLDPSHPLDLELLIASVREADRTNLELEKKRSPFDYRRRATLRIVACSHATVRFVRRQFIDLAFELADELSVPEKLRGTFLLEYGRVGLEIDDERHTEADLYLRSRWRVISQNSHFAERIFPVSFPVNQIDDFPWGLENWLGRPFVPWKDDPELTRGANSLCRLAANLGRFELIDWITEKEKLWRGKVPPIGCEIQIPLGDRNTSLLKKQILRRLGIPSPRRPEYRAMVEAAFRPSASWHAILLGPMLLVELGIIDCPQELALHISVQGDVGAEVRYLATCATFIHMGRKRRPHSALTRVMSKGLVCRNDDVEECLSEMIPNCRTEIRLHRCFAEADANQKVSVDLTYADDILATHLLATAAMSTRPELSAIYSTFCEKVSAAIRNFPPVFGEYLHTDFYQSTGDPHDPRLLEIVPVVAKLKAVRDAVRRENMREELEQTFLEIRDRAAWNVLLQVAGSESEALSEWKPEQYPHSAVWPI